MATGHYEDIVATRRALGRPVAGFDARIGAICHCASTTLATRNTPDSEGMGVPLVNPWDTPAVL